MHKRIRELQRYVKYADWKILGLRAAIIAGGILMLTQIFYPGGRMLPFARVDGVNVGWMSKTDAIKKVNTAYSKYPIAIYMGDDKKAFKTPTLATAAITVDNTDRINKTSYPWYLRILPTSLFWAQFKTPKTPAPAFSAKTDAYIEKALMPECRKAPTDATLKPTGDKLAVVSAIPGGECDKDDVTRTIKKATPKLGKTTSVRVALKELAPQISDKDAKVAADALNKRLTNGVPIKVNSETIRIATKDVLPWLDFSNKDGKLYVSVNAEQSAAFFNATFVPKVAIKPGTSFITTRDFTEVSRTNGASGQALDTGTTLEAIRQFITDEADVIAVATKVVPPLEQYTRTYSPTDAGLSALLENYAKDHPGTFGISLIEMDGKKRRANYNGDKEFITASTYKLFVAYSLMKRIDAGTKDWNSSADCFNKMITYSDNACAEMFLNDMGLKNVTNDINAIGLKNSNFTKTGGPFTTANDLSLLLGMLQSGQNFSGVNRERLIGAMTSNVYRKGIPAGATGKVADKVGFMDGLLHDAAIVYSPSGTYVLTVMTEGSSWATIADLAKQIDSLRAQ